MYRATPKGIAAVEEWMGEPVEQLREINSTFLLKLAFAQRSGRDIGPLLSQQREILESLVAGLAGELDVEPGEPNLHLRLRLEIAQTVLRFLNGLELPGPPATSHRAVGPLPVSPARATGQRQRRRRPPPLLALVLPFST